MRVFVTGFGIVSSFGNSWDEIKKHFYLKENAVRYMKEWDQYVDLNTRLAAPIDNYKHPSNWTRKDLRSLGKVSQYAVHSAGLALLMANFLNENFDKSNIGVASGSSTGSTDAIVNMANLILNNENSNFNANTYIKIMPHTTAANIALFYSLQGRVIPTSSACTSASHAIGYAYETIKFGKIDMMVAGGAEELCPSEAFVFDNLYATSIKNTTPKLTPSPFDTKRDGLVLGEGGAYLILESEKSVLKRGIKPIAEIVGFGSTCDGTHITRPNKETMKKSMILAIEDANISPNDIKYVNAHATATKYGDIAETLATNEVFGKDISISSLKSYLGHTLGACGSQEAIFSIMMMNEDTFFPTINLNEIDKECGELNYLKDITNIQTQYVMSNNFAFGGINTSLIFKRL